MSELTAELPAFTNKTLRAAIIDLDGTMIDTADDFVAGLNGMLARIGTKATDRDEVIGYIGKGSENLIRSVLAVRFSALEQPRSSRTRSRSIRRNTRASMDSTPPSIPKSRRA